MLSTDLLPPVVALVPFLSLAGIALSASASSRSHRWIYGVLGWIGWAATVAAGVFVALVLRSLSCWGSSVHSCGESGTGWIVIGAAAAMALPGIVAYGFGPQRS